MITILIIILILMLVGVLPDWIQLQIGNGPGGGLVSILVILIILRLSHTIYFTFLATALEVRPWGQPGFAG